MQNKCYICNETKLNKRKGAVRDNPELDILECSCCGLVFLSSFKHVEEGFYEDSNMHDFYPDVESLNKATITDNERRYKQFEEVLINKDILDIGCGTAGFLIKAREKAKNVYGIEIEKRLQHIYKENSLEVYTSIEEFDKKVDIVFLFHVLEHIPDPIPLLKQIKKVLKPGGKIIVEVPNSDDVLLTLYDCEAYSKFTYWSPHLYLYNHRTLSELFRIAGMGTQYIKQFQRYPLSNHLYWLAKGKPGGHSEWSFLDSGDEYANSLAAVGKCDTIIGSFS